ncbi:MAG: RNA polymerase sigma factor, partial [Pirellulales bacterium]|nr:RNA polymerase sigma factor [Pirellulales bacterium]
DLLVRGLSKSLSGNLGGGLQAEDIVQEAIIKILDSLDSFEGRSKFTTWAMTIATRLGISELRRKRYGDVSMESLQRENDLTFDVVADSVAGDSDQLDRQKLLDKLNGLIETELTEKQRLAMKAILAGLPIEEISRRLDSNRNAVYKLVHDARMRLRKGFEQSGIMAEDVAAIFA